MLTEAVPMRLFNRLPEAEAEKLDNILGDVEA